MENSVEVVFGMSKMGKTYFLNQQAAEYDRVIFVDPMSQFRDGLIFRTMDDLLQYFERYNPDKFRVICRFEETDEDFEQTESLLKLTKKLKDVYLVIDEVDKISREGAVSKTLWQIINYYRHDGISLICCARRPARVSRDLTGNADRIVCFKVQEPNDLKYLAEFGFKENDLRSLAKYEYVTTSG